MIKSDILKLLGKNTYSSMKKFKKKYCGKKLNSGCTRVVYEFKPDRRYVVKIQYKDGHLHNSAEFLMWDSNWCSPFQDMLAPCLWISNSGRILIQRRVSFRQKYRYPDTLPSCFNDHKFTNYGWIGKRFVCCDYAGLKIKMGRLRKINWWDLQKTASGNYTVKYRV